MSEERKPLEPIDTGSASKAASHAATESASKAQPNQEEHRHMTSEHNDSNGNAAAHASNGKENPSSETAPPPQAAAQAAAPSPKESLEREDDSGPDMNSEFAKMLDDARPEDRTTDLQVGAKVTGRIVQIGDDTSFIDFGGRSEALVETRHLRNADNELEYQIGDAIELFVTDNEGDQIKLSPSLELKADAALEQLTEARRSKLPVKGKVSSLNAGGLEVRISGQRAFCPFSQVELGFCAEPSNYLGQELEFLITDITEGGKNIVVSRRALLRRAEDQRAKTTMAKIEEGSEVSGRVTRLQPFGAFVNLGGIEGLVHVSEISYARVNSPRDVLRPGQEVKVRVLKMENLDTKKPRISLSIKALLPDPWNDVEGQFWMGKKTKGIVTRLADFGAFVELIPGIEGLVHVSEVSATPVKHPKEVLKPGQSVEVSVLNVDLKKQRISLSIRENEMPDAADMKQPAPGDITDGWVAGVKHFGVFVDLPDYGHRARGLVPHDETGEKRGAELEKIFNVGDRVKVAITDVGSDGKIRLSMRRVTEAQDQKQVEDYQKKTRSESRPGSGPASGSPGGAPRRSTAVEDAFRKAMRND